MARTRTTPTPAKPAESAERFGEAVVELQALLRLLQRASGEGRIPVYVKCMPLLKEIKELNKPPYPVREVKALAHEADWHLRSLAGLAASSLGKDDEHAAWALASLNALAVCAEQA